MKDILCNKFQAFTYRIALRRKFYHLMPQLQVFNNVIAKGSGPGLSFYSARDAAVLHNTLADVLQGIDIIGHVTAPLE